MTMTAFTLLLTVILLTLFYNYLKENSVKS